MKLNIPKLRISSVQEAKGKSRPIFAQGYGPQVSPRAFWRRRSFYFALALAAAMVVSPLFFLKPSSETEQQQMLVRSALASHKSQMDPELREQLAAIVLKHADALEIPAATRIDGRPVRPALYLLAQMWVESEWEVRARSYVNAQGLMQVMPSTAWYMIDQLGIPRRDSYYDPEENIRLGISYMNEMIRQFGSLEDAATAYNVGPGAFIKGVRNPRYFAKIARTYRVLSGDDPELLALN